jgi:hypothetical protein
MIRRQNLLHFRSTTMDYRLSFLGAPTYLLQQTELQQIIDKNTELCTKLSLSGLFLYLNGSSLKIIEGSQINVDQYFALIDSYKWHSRLIVIGREAIEEKLFDFYLIAYKIPGATRLSTLEALLESTNLHKSFSEPSRLILGLIANFYKNNPNN